MKAKTLYICTFTLAQTDNIDSFPALDRQFYEAAAMGTSELIFQDGFKDMDGNVLTSACSFQNPNFQDFLKAANAPAPPFVAIIGEFPDGQKRLYITKSPQQVKNLIKQMWLGEFGGTTPMPTNLGDGEGGWGEGSSVVCKIFPPLCALGFLPWLVLAGIATYKTAESRSTLGKATWGIPAALLWLGFFERGGVKQIQWWLKKAGIGSLPSQFTNAKTTKGTLETLQKFIRANWNQMEPETRQFWITVRDILNGEVIKPATKRKTMAQIIESAYNIEKIMKKHGAADFSFETT